MQAFFKDVFDARELQFGVQFSSETLGIVRQIVADLFQIGDDASHASHQRARHIGLQHHQFGHTGRRDDVAIHLAIDFERRHRAQQCGPVIEIGLGARFVGIVRGQELDIKQARGIVSPLQERAEADEVEGFVLQHGAQRDAARQMGAVLDPFEETRRIVFQLVARELLLQFDPGGVFGFPYFGGQGAAHGPGILARRRQAARDRRWIIRVAHHEVDNGRLRQRRIFGIERWFQFGNAEQCAPSFFGFQHSVRHQCILQPHVEHAGRIFGALGVAGHPEQVICGAAQHGSFSSIQVSFVPPPCDELTTSEPSCSATRVSPPGTIETVLPDSTKGRRSMWRGAMPDST